MLVYSKTYALLSLHKRNLYEYFIIALIKRKTGGAAKCRSQNAICVNKCGSKQVGIAYSSGQAIKF